MKLVVVDRKNDCEARILANAVQEKFKIPIGVIEFPSRSRRCRGLCGDGRPRLSVERQLDGSWRRPMSQSSVFFMLAANCRSNATNAVEATESVRSRR
jgi:hypothetical protein